jgi:hypothetical protein
MIDWARAMDFERCGLALLHPTMTMVAMMVNPVDMMTRRGFWSESFSWRRA